MTGGYRKGCARRARNWRLHPTQSSVAAGARLRRRGNDIELHSMYERLMSETRAAVAVGGR